jgi:O-antigen ligase
MLAIPTLASALTMIAVISLLFSTVTRTFSGVALVAFLALIFTQSIRLALKHKNSFSSSRSGADIASASSVLMIFCLLAFILKSIPSIYWGESPFSNNFEIRILLASIAAYLISHLKINFTLSNNVIIISTVGAIYFSIPHTLLYANKSMHPPYHIISWMGGITFFCSLALFGTLQKNLGLKLFSFVGMTIGCLLVYLSGIRATYPIPVLILAAALILNRDLIKKNLGILLIVGICISSAFFFLNGHEIIKKRVSTGFNDINLIIANQGSPELFANSSLGARFYMWKKSIEIGMTSPIVGIGQIEARKVVKEWGASIDANVVARQRHVHNDYAQSFIDHGLLGLSSWLFIIAGITLASLIIMKSSFNAGLILLLISFGHAFMTFFNTNSAHNNYPTFLALSLVIFFKITNAETHEKDVQVGKK